MPDFPGRLTVINGQSNLDNDLLVRPGFSDPAQAIAAATQFLLKTKQLISGQKIIVTGDKGSFGDISIIVMTNAQPDPSQPFAFGLETVSTTKTQRAGANKSGSAKSASASRDGGSKAGASKKSARKRGAAKSSAKKK
ncbi:MAG: hypothetical protein LC794_14915 [Acidobacteria bacterium]|nr:hypothetical protein [Acidobacteriota bacterium]MCA1627965.1 hypothetical protein [Acidobacteriota bacterium]